MDYFTDVLIKFLDLDRVKTPVHTKHDNYKDNDKDIVRKIKE